LPNERNVYGGGGVDCRSLRIATTPVVRVETGWWNKQNTTLLNGAKGSGVWAENLYIIIGGGTFS
jgi:hypothetical protein